MFLHPDQSRICADGSLAVEAKATEAAEEEAEINGNRNKELG